MTPSCKAPGVDRPGLEKCLRFWGLACTQSIRMPDHFATLAQPRRPWLDEEGLKEAFHRATAQQHPDVAGGSGHEASALNAAYAVLRDPAARLKHLLELEAPEALQIRSGVSPAFAEAFGKLAALHQRVAAWEKEQAAMGVLARALGIDKRNALVKDVESWIAALREAETRAFDELRELDARWEQRDSLVASLIAAAQQHFAFLAQWQAQLREDLFRLGGYKPPS